MKLILLLLMFVATQAGDLSGKVAGKVVDSQGAALRSARVSVRNQSGFIVRETLTGEQGEFRIEGLEPGIYFVAVDAEGLIQTNGPQEIKLDQSGVPSITIRLDLSAVRDSILVSDTRTDSRAAGVQTAPMWSLRVISSAPSVQASSMLCEMRLEPM